VERAKRTLTTFLQTVTSTHPLTPALHLDPRHVLWLPEERTLVAADLHLGYVWAHRHSGQLLPISAPDDTIDRLAGLVAEYRPAQLVLLGDIVHRAIPIPAIRDQLQSLASSLSSVSVRWIAGNHDYRLQPLLRDSNLPGISLEPDLPIGSHFLTHGDPLARPRHNKREVPLLPRRPEYPHLARILTLVRWHQHPHDSLPIRSRPRGHLHPRLRHRCRPHPPHPVVNNPDISQVFYRA